jgi:hypothetical protein
MRILSVDVPWSAKNYLGLAWTESTDPEARIEARFLKAESPEVLERAEGWTEVFESLGGHCDLILLDQPIGMLHPVWKTDAYRPVERAWGNRFFHPAKSGPRIQFPRFQPGTRHCEPGRRRAGAVVEAMGTGAVVLESFPQLSIPVLLNWNKSRRKSDAVARLASHKAGRLAEKERAQLQLLHLVSAFCGRQINVQVAELGSAGAADMVDAALGLAAGLALVRALPEGRPKAVRLIQPDVWNGLPKSADEVLLSEGIWWKTAATWLQECRASATSVPANGILALQWW